VNVIVSYLSWYFDQLGFDVDAFTQNIPFISDPLNKPQNFIESAPLEQVVGERI